MQGEAVLTFRSTHDSISAEKALVKGGVYAACMPLPESVKAGCGIALRVEKEQLGKALGLLRENEIVYEALLERRKGGFEELVV